MVDDTYISSEKGLKRRISMKAEVRLLKVGEKNFHELSLIGITFINPPSNNETFSLCGALSTIVF